MLQDCPCFINYAIIPIIKTFSCGENLLSDFIFVFNYLSLQEGNIKTYKIVEEAYSEHRQTSAIELFA